MNILFRCDGSTEIGLGHVVRCLALADELKTAHGCSVTFAMRKSKLGMEMVRKFYPVLTPHVDNENFNYEVWLYDLVQFTESDVLVLDVRDGLDPLILEKIKAKNILVVDIDDNEKKRLRADLVFYPPVPQVEEMNWKGFSGKLFCGWEWVILRKEFASRNPSPCNRDKLDKNGPHVLVTMGGSDPKAMTFKVIKALNQIRDSRFLATVVIGAGFAEREKLDQEIRSCRVPARVLENVSDMAGLMKTADMAVCAFGVTAYELAASGVPAIHMCLTRDHEKSSESFVKAGVAEGVGLYNSTTIQVLSEKIKAMIKSSQKRSQMKQTGMGLFSACGVDNIAKTIVSAIR
ncbi:MAG: hypothetical protein FP816_14615 [Desulfobacteraceae bacterium]|nr:hypothetical protein [Desulfobacteraceae bacterium]MBU4001970.1 hypothetical protein [Pseudomonadota bacterium]MBU4055910.1 hypothetical protein [Pseudomonadota bacterium]